MQRFNDTIAAISTPVGKSGIGIVRLSGSNALSIADKIFTPSNGTPPSQFLSHSLHYGQIKDIDEVLLAVMRSPRTYTREDIVEINCHSGIVVLRRILELVLQLGARLATPGEFTKRAYLNGRIDLAQAEAVLDVINSQTADALNVALGQLQGRLSRKVNALRKGLLDILMQLELSIDFSDQDVQLESQDELLSQMSKLAQSLEELLDSAERGTILRQGITCVICGRPNVGKSSLLNALLKRDRAIVTSIPGTTRDSLEETLDLFGIPLRLIDTAGIIQGRDLAEKEAAKRSVQCIKEANFALLVLDASQGLRPEDLSISRYISHKPAFVILNKEDLPAKISVQDAGRILPGKKVLSICALRSRGLDRLERELAEDIWQGKAASSCADVLVINIRHKEALKRACRFLQQAMKALKTGLSPEIVALEVKEAQRSLSEIIGELRSEDILEQIFSQFCIGK